MSTYVPSQKDITRQWHVIDADAQVLGRLATVAARLLQGKHRPGYVPFLDTGDRRHSGYLGGLREDLASKVRQEHPERLVESAIRGMLPKTKLGKAMYRKLKVYAGADHPHTAQNPTTYEVA